MRFAPQFRHFALVGICAAGWLSIPYQIAEHAIEQPERESPYLTAPGNRSQCDMWVAHQSDSSGAPWIVKCVGGKRV